MTRIAQAAPAALLRAGSVISLVVFLNACGGGDGDGAPPNSAPTSAPNAAPNPTPPPPGPPSSPVPPAASPAPLVVATAESIDGGANGDPVDLRVARSANGDDFAVWRADDGVRHNLWANSFRAATAAWGSPISIETSSADIDDFDLAVDANGNAVVAWHEAPGDPRAGSGVVMAARFDTRAGAWSTPMPLNANSGQPRVASDASGAALAVYVVQSVVVRGRFFDPSSGTWQPEAAIEQNTTGTGFSSLPVPLLDGNGNALVAFHNARTGAELLASNYFARSAGGWGQLPADQSNLLGVVPGSLTILPDLGVGNVQLATTTDGNFLLAWNVAGSIDSPESGAIAIAYFMSGTRTWSAAQTLVPGNAQKNVQLQRLGSDVRGNVHLLWTENDGIRTALNAVLLASGACTAAQVIDSAVGGGAARADLGVDPTGSAVAIWQQFESGHPDDGSRSNIAINRYDSTAGAWASAVFAETQPGNAISPHASASGGQALLGWIQSEGGANRVKALLQPLGGSGR